MLTIEEIRRAVMRVGEKYGIKSAYLFGSYAKDVAREDSDVDIIIDDGGNIKSLIDLSGFRLDLIGELDGAKVDVLTMDGVRSRFFDLIKDDMVLIYEA